MTWLLIHYDKTVIDKVIVINGNWKKLHRYLIDNVEELYDPFFADIIDCEHYMINGHNKLRTYVYRDFHGCKLDKFEIIPLIQEFFEKFPKKMKCTLKYYGGTCENDKYPIIQLLKCDNVIISQ